MSGVNESLLDLPPGLNRTTSQYAAGKTWWNGNLIRWANRMLTPIGGWVKLYEFQAPEDNPPALGIDEPIRTTHSWRDLLKDPWAAYGSANKLWGSSVGKDGTYTFYDITPASLGYNPGGRIGYGSGLYGKGTYGLSAASGITVDGTSLWSLDNFGKLLVGVASQDGRLVIWDPVTPTQPATAVSEAPPDNSLVIATDEEFLMVLGGKNNPRRVKWASRRTYTDWTPTETNTAGGFDLQSNGTIVAACLVPGGILVITDTDAHIIEYVGPPYYYGRRRISDECEVVSPNALLPLSFGAVWMGQTSFWMYNGTVNKLPCSVELDVFYSSEKDKSYTIHGGINQYAQEAWWFYPGTQLVSPNKYVVFGYNQQESPYWTIGEMSRTAWLNPVWQEKPLAVDNQILYLQETGNSADGAPRNVFAETGVLEFENGTSNVRIDRIYPDIVNPIKLDQQVDNVQVTFKLKQAPSAMERTYGPVNINLAQGYVPLRMRARQITMRISEVTPGSWSLGKMRLRVKEAGRR
jgi:hypothetical protein